MIYRTTYAMVYAAGSRAARACVAAGGKSPAEWTVASLRCAAAWLARGDRRGGVSRPWPGLSARIEAAADHEEMLRVTAAKRIVDGVADVNREDPANADTPGEKQTP